MKRSSQALNYNDIDEYQQETLRTAGNSGPDRLTVTALGLTGEAGEFAEIIKKHKFHDHVLDKDKALKELGDVQWYLAVAAHELGFKMSELLEQNVLKLRARYPQGFDPERSKNRGTDL
jgi:NTP pyrophosphatase (non-canonical NTP hydrolase)